MAKCFYVLFLFVYLANCQIKNVNLVGYKEYFEEVFNEFVRIMEEKHWSNLKLPDMEQTISTTALGQTVSGTVKYTNGFVESIQGINILNSDLAPKFVSNATFATAQVSGTIRMIDVAVGFDAEANVDYNKTYYTGVTTLSLINNYFTILKDIYTNEITITCETSVPWNPSTMSLLPTDFLADVISSTYVLNSANSGVEAWSDVFVPIVEDIARNTVPFPEICYNCSIE